MTKISDYPNERTTEPNDDDLVDISIEAPAGVFTSHKMKWSVIKAAFGIGSGTPFVIPRYDNSGILVDSGMTESEPGISILTDTLGIGVEAHSNVSLNIKGESSDDTKQAIYAENSDGDYIFWLENDGILYLKNGTGINEFSTDGTLVGDSDLAVPTEKAVKTYVDGLVTPQIIGGVTLSSSSNTNILNGTYVILADTTTVTSVTSGIGQDSNWTLEITQAGTTNQKGVVTFTGNLQKDGGGGNKLYDIALFKNGSIISESEQEGQKLENNDKGQSVTVMAITEFSTNDTFDIRVSGNGTAEDIFCGGGSLYIQ